VTQNEFDAPKTGLHSLKDYFEALASQKQQSGAENMKIIFYGYNTFLVEPGDKKSPSIDI